MVVSRNDNVQCTCGRRGARDPQAAAGGEECRGTPASEAKSSEGKSGVKPGELAIGFPQPPFPRPAPQVTSETLPYRILRRMSTDEHSAAPLANLQLLRLIVVKLLGESACCVQPYELQDPLLG